MSEDGKERLIANLAGAIAQVSREDIAERAIGNVRQADEDFGKRLEAVFRPCAPFAPKPAPLSRTWLLAVGVPQ